jgi:hypothetical protein
MPINFPDSPSVNDTHTVLGKTWVWNGTYWKLSGSSNRGISLQVSDTAPSDPVAGDMWYESDTGRTFTYYDGAWIELGNTASVTAFLADADADTLVHVEESADSDTIAFTTGGTKRLEIDASGHVIPAANETYDLGSVSNRFRDLYLSGTTIDLGGVEISSDGTSLTMPPVSNISGDFTVDTDTLHVDSTNNRVGIGTASPTQELHIYTGSANADVRLQGDPSGHMDVYHGPAVAGLNATNAVTMQFGTSGTTRMAIDSSGNVGIGTTSPGAKLEVSGSGAGATRIEGTAVGSNADGYELNLVGGTPDSYVNAGGRIRLGGGTRGDADIDSVIFMRDTTESARIHSNGMLGVNTASPTGRVHIYSNTAGNGLDANYLKIDRANTSTESAINLATAGANKWFLGQDNVGNDDFYLYSWVGGKYAMHVTPDGEVLHPEQPAFYAWKSNSTQTTTASNERITFPSVTVNNGNHFNTSTSLFTAPVAGVYYFSFRALTGNDGTDGDARLQYNGAIANQYSCYASNAITGHKQTILSGAINLNANDTVGISSWTSGRTFYGSSNYGHTSFSGHLIG